MADIIKIIFDEKHEDKNTITIKNIEVVVDFDAKKEVIGIEIINLKYQTGIEEIASLKDETTGRSMSYDEECDAIYIKLINEYSTDQKVVCAEIKCTNKKLISIKIDLKNS